jgi:hypothetical protein
MTCGVIAFMRTALDDGIHRIPQRPENAMNGIGLLGAKPTIEPPLEPRMRRLRKTP